jgi:hypothetical protein
MNGPPKLNKRTGCHQRDIRRLLILTGQRRGEVAMIIPPEIANGIWTITRVGAGLRADLWTFGVNRLAIGKLQSVPDVL